MWEEPVSSRNSPLNGDAEGDTNGLSSSAENSEVSSLSVYQLDKALHWFPFVLSYFNWDALLKLSASSASLILKAFSLIENNAPELPNSN